MDQPSVLTVRSRAAAPAGALHRALTDPDAVRSWLTDQADIDLAQGRYGFWGRHAPDGDRPRQRLLEHRPDRLLRFAWDLKSGPVTVTVRLEPRDHDDTEITVTHEPRPPAGTPGGNVPYYFWDLAVDNLVNLVEGRRLAPRFEPGPVTDGRARAQVTIDAAPGDVYASLIEAGPLSEWTGGTASVEPWVGGRYDFGWDHGPGDILLLDPGRALAYTWTYPDTPETVVRWELADLDGATQVMVVHGRFDDADLATDFQGGWQAYLRAIKRLHERGHAWNEAEVR
ncbi:SRPBCC family protein [Marinitenerispora sediminis]|nr:SRPBCC family protein [Marinitenerispora sediminis]